MARPDEPPTPPAPPQGDLSPFVVHVSAGEFVFREGDASMEMYVIEDGSVELVKHYTESDTRQVTVLEVGDFFGEWSLLERCPREVSARAVTDSRLLRIDAATFGQVVGENPEIVVRMLRKLAHRLNEYIEADARAARIAMGPLAPTPGPAAAAIRPCATLVHPASGSTFALPVEGEATVGRIDLATGLAPDVDLTAVDVERSAGRRHARIIVRDGQYFVREEPGTRNGTSVNGRRLTSADEVPLHDGDRVAFGLVELVLKAG